MIAAIGNVDVPRWVYSDTVRIVKLDCVYSPEDQVDCQAVRTVLWLRTKTPLLYTANPSYRLERTAAHLLLQRANNFPQTSRQCAMAHFVDHAHAAVTDGSLHVVGLVENVTDGQSVGFVETRVARRAGSDEAGFGNRSCSRNPIPARHATPPAAVAPRVADTADQRGR